MLALLSEVRFWSTQDELCIKDTDYGASKYYERKENTLSVSSRSKKEYAERRDYLWNLTNKRPAKLKDKLKELEDQILQNRVVFCKWADTDVLQIMLCTGILINICVNTCTGDIRKISSDKYLVGKLQSECISDVLITRSNILCTYNDNQITVVHFTKPSVSQSVCEKLHRLEPRLTVSELAGPAGRKLDRKMSTNVSGDKLLVWWRCTRDEVYPWSPLVKDQDRANIHVYNMSGPKLELLCYRRTEFDPVGVTFSTTDSNIIHCVEQKVSRKGVVTVETCTYEIVKSKLQQLLITSIPLQTQVCCHAFSPDNEKLLLGCIDGSVVLFDQGRGVTHLVKAAFIPTIASWHLDGAVILVANERCQIQCFDVSLASVKCQTMHEDTAPSTVLDLTAYFKAQPTLIQMAWNRKPQLVFQCHRYVHTDALLLLLFEHGPLTIVRLVANTGARGDVHTPGLTADVLVTGYIQQNQIDRAIGIVLSLNWDMYGPSCLMALQRIIGHLIKQRLTPETEAQIQRALGSYYAPLQPISEEVHTEFGEQVKDLTRKFFHLLVRYRMFEKAFCLAIDVNDYDLFMDLYYCAQVVDNEEMAVAALNRAKDLISRSNSSNGDHSVCSHSSCSQCSDSDGNDSWANACVEDVTSFSTVTVPPLPVPLEQPVVPPVLPPPPLPMLHAPSNRYAQLSAAAAVRKPAEQMASSAGSNNRTYSGLPGKQPSTAATSLTVRSTMTPRAANELTSTHPSAASRAYNEFGSSVPVRQTVEPGGSHSLRNGSDGGSTLATRPGPEFPSSLSGKCGGSEFSNLSAPRISSECGSALSLRLASEFGSTLSVKPGSEFGSALSMKPGSEFGSTLSMKPGSEFGSTLSMKPGTEFGSTLSMKPDSEFGSTLSMKPGSEFASALSMKPGSEFGSTLSIRSANELTQRNEAANSHLLPARSTSSRVLDGNTVGILKPRNFLSASTLSAFKSVDSGSASSLLRPFSVNATGKLYNNTVAASSGGAGVPVYPSIFANAQLSVPAVAPPPAREMIVHRTVSMNIPPAAGALGVTDAAPLKLSVPLQCGSGTGASGSSAGATKTTGEKNVKFSETVTAFIVPEITRSDKVTLVKDRPRRPSNRYLTDPKQELADSLPLCHPNDEYLKDFTPITNNSEDDDPGTKIKVVHFGMV